MASEEREESLAQSVNFEVRVAGRFKMDRLIGHGSFGQIYMAKDMVTDRDVAVKFEHKSQRRPQVVEEARLLSELQGEGKSAPFTDKCSWLSIVHLVRERGKPFYHGDRDARPFS